MLLAKKTKFKNFLINLFGFIWFELYNIYENNKPKNMRKKFTKSQFEAVRKAISNQISIIEGPPRNWENSNHIKYYCKYCK